MSSNKKVQASITSFFGATNYNNKRTLSERELSSDNKQTSQPKVVEISNKPKSNGVKKEEPESDVFYKPMKKKKVIDDEDEIEENFSSILKVDSAKKNEENNHKIEENVNNFDDLEGFKNIETESRTLKKLKTNNESQMSKDTPDFKQRNSAVSVAHINPALDLSIVKGKNNEKIAKSTVKVDKNAKKPTKNGKKGEDSEDEDEGSQMSSTSNPNLTQNSSPEDNLPDFLKYENLKDLNGKRPEDEDYDPTTLYVPDSFLKKQTPTQQQFWGLKKHNFDKVLFFKLGKFYELFFDDAIIGNKILDLNWMGADPKKLHVGFPEKMLEKYAAILVENGFKVAVIEQTETPEEMEERNKQNKTKDKNLRRELCNVFTKGTFSQTNGENSAAKDGDSAVYANKYCMAIVNFSAKDLEVSEKESQEASSGKNPILFYFGFVLFDVTTLNFYIGEVQEDETYNKIQSIFYNVKPEEVVYFRNNLPSYLENFVKGLSSKPLLTVRKNDFNLMKSYHLIREHFGENQDKWDPLINQYILDKRYSNISAAFYLSINFLKNLLLAETVRVAKFYKYSEGIVSKINLTMDYQAIHNLELVETNLDPEKPESGSFVEFMIKYCTGFGMGEMRKWILNPLTDVAKIEERLDIVEEFIGNYDLMTRFRLVLSKLPDFERSCGRIYKSATQRSSKAVYFEDISKQKLNEFFKLLEDLKNSEEFREKIKSKKLLRMTMKEGETFIHEQSEEVLKGMVPNIRTVVDDFQNLFKKNKGDKENTIEPEEGVDEEYDACKKRIEEIEEELKEILDKERKKFKCNLITFAHTKFYRYELEFPEEIVAGDKRPKNYKLTTNKKGFLRFHTPEIEKLVTSLELEESSLKNALKQINTAIFKRFYSKHQIVGEYIRNLAELDCLANLAVIHQYLQETGPMTRPVFINNLSNSKPYLNLKQMRHPILSSRISNFVANDTTIGYEKQIPHNSNIVSNNTNPDFKSTLLITGPNMGGKSTILRQTCIAVIMAQIGSFIPAEACELTVVDRIFTRIGARDRILEGKSTFFIEMEETKTVLDYASVNSLVIMDELGRGTSTNEGMVIAKSVLEFITKKVKCRTLFTTHYHDLVDGFRDYPGVDLYHMDCNVDDKSHSVNYLYKFVNGICPKS